MLANPALLKNASREIDLPLMEGFVGLNTRRSRDTQSSQVCLRGRNIFTFNASHSPLPNPGEMVTLLRSRLTKEEHYTSHLARYE